MSGRWREIMIGEEHGPVTAVTSGIEEDYQTYVEWCHHSGFEPVGLGERFYEDWKTKRRALEAMEGDGQSLPRA
jgi:hypothetical protein